MIQPRDSVVLGEHDELRKRRKPFPWTARMQILGGYAMKSYHMTRRRALQCGAASFLGTAGIQGVAQARRRRRHQQIFASSKDVPLLQLPEGITATEAYVFVGTYNY